MNINQIESFLAIARSNSFSIAAKQLNLTQSTISARIQLLEAQVGAPLFERLGRGVHLTYKGKMLMPYAERLITTFNELKAGVVAPPELSGTLRIGVAEMVAVTWLPDLTRAASTRYPKIKLEYEVALNPELVSKVKSRTLDLAFCCPTNGGKGLTSTSLGSVAFSWMIGEGVPMREGRITRAELGDLGVILQGNGYTTATILDWFGDVAPNRRATCNSMAAIRSLVVGGVGAGLLPVEFFGDDLDTGVLKLILSDPSPPQVEFCTLNLTERETDPLVRALKQLADEINTFETSTR